MAVETPTIDRQLAEELVVELDGLAEAERIRTGSDQTPMQEALYAVLERLERAALGTLTDDERTALHERGEARGQELVREWFAALLTDDEEVVATK